MIQDRQAIDFTAEEISELRRLHLGDHEGKNHKQPTTKGIRPGWDRGTLRKPYFVLRANK